jgi:hypothetical protein
MLSISLNLLIPATVIASCFVFVIINFFVSLRLIPEISLLKAIIPTIFLDLLLQKTIPHQGKLLVLQHKHASALQQSKLLHLPILQTIQRFRRRWRLQSRDSRTVLLETQHFQLTLLPKDTDKTVGAQWTL